MLVNHIDVSTAQHVCAYGALHPGDAVYVDVQPFLETAHRHVQDIVSGFWLNDRWHSGFTYADYLATAQQAQYRLRRAAPRQTDRLPLRVMYVAEPYPHFVAIATKQHLAHP